MDKEIIIDGVDVTGCEFIGDIKNKFVKCTSWVHNSKKQVSGHWDCEENKACYYKQLKRLEQENAELKAENERLKEKIESYVCSQNCYAYKQVDKYRHILQEIKDICKNSYTSASEDYYRTSDKILQKITKAEEE